MNWPIRPERDVDSANLMDLYVYYRVRADDAMRLQPQVEAMQRALAHSHHVQCSLRRRPEETDARQTWMEIYLDVPEGFLSALAGAAASFLLIDGDRHVETFVDFPHVPDRLRMEAAAALSAGGGRQP